jgi:hypothetical protein
MGQFGNQPDFGTQAITLVPQGDPDTGYDTGFFINPPCALYVGTGGDILVQVVGGDLNDNTFDGQSTLFKNVPSGTFMPVMVSYVWADFSGNPVTTAADIVGLY